MISKPTAAFGSLLLGSGLYFGLPLSASADTLNLSYSETASGTTGSGIVSPLAVPGSYFYGNTYTAPTSAIPGSSYGFFDDYLFSISGAVGNTITSSIDLSTLLGFSDVMVRLYSVDGQSSLPVLGTPVGTVIYATSSSVTYAPGVTGIVNVIPDTILASGTYVLEVYGDVSGTAGGSYSGTLNLSPTPVPVPAALPMLLSGLGLLGGLFGKRKTTV